MTASRSSRSEAFERFRRWRSRSAHRSVLATRLGRPRACHAQRAGWPVTDRRRTSAGADSSSDAWASSRPSSMCGGIQRPQPAGVARWDVASRSGRRSRPLPARNSTTVPACPPVNSMAVRNITAATARRVVALASSAATSRNVRNVSMRRLSASACRGQSPAPRVDAGTQSRTHEARRCRRIANRRRGTARRASMWMPTTSRMSTPSLSACRPSSCASASRVPSDGGSATRGRARSVVQTASVVCRHAGGRLFAGPAISCWATLAVSAVASSWSTVRARICRRRAHARGPRGTTDRQLSARCVGAPTTRRQDRGCSRMEDAGCHRRMRRASGNRVAHRDGTARRRLPSRRPSRRREQC